MKRILMTLLLALALAGTASAAQPILSLDFESEGDLEDSSGSGRLVEGYEGTQSLLIEEEKGDGSVNRRFRLPADKLAGELITLQAAVRGEDVSKPPKSWNGVKVMLVLQHEGGGRDYPQLDVPSGTFEWTEFKEGLRVPKSVTSATLVLGLEKVSGRAWFDNVRVRTGRPVTGGERKERKFKGHDLSRLRGVMYGPETEEEDIRVLAKEWGANMIRLQINWTPMRPAEKWARDLDDYQEWLDGILPEIDRGMDLCEKYGLLVLLDLHTPPGGRVEGGVCPLFRRRDAQEKFVEVWRRLARRYKDRECIWACDLLNEPVEPPPGPDVVTWEELFTRATKAIREIDPGMPVVYEPGPWGTCDGFDETVVLDLDRVIYSFHMYQPHQFTHQTIHGNPGGVEYPGEVNGRHWDKEALRDRMQPARDFQKDFNVQIYLGEFSAIRWAPEGSAYRYLKDCISLFEEWGWDWSYHAYREWHGWSVEHGNDRSDTSRTEQPTRRKKLLLKWFEKNEKPRFARD